MPPGSPLRRHPRGRPDRGGRPHPRPRRAPAQRPCRPSPRGSAGSAASSACAAAPRTRCGTSASTRSSAGASPTRARPGGCGSPTTTRAPTAIALSNPLSEDQSAMRTTAARLAARRRRSAIWPAAPSGVALFESGRVYLNHPPTGRNPRHTQGDRPIGPCPAGSRASRRRRCRAAPDRLPCGGAADCRGRGAAEVSPPTSLPSRACWRRLPGSSASSSLSRPARSRSCTRAAPPTCQRWRRDRRLDRRAAPARLPGLGPRGGRRLRSRPGGADRRRHRGRGDLRGRDQLPGGPPGPRRRRPGRGHGSAGSRAPSLPAAASCCSAAEVFDLYEGEQVGEGKKSLALRLEFRAPDRTLTDEEVARLRVRRSRPSWRRSGGRSVADLASQPLARRARRPGPGRRRLRLHRGAGGADRLAPPEAGAGRRHLAQRRRHPARPASTRATGCRSS